MRIIRQSTGDKLGDITVFARQLRDEALLADPAVDERARICLLVAEELLAIMTNRRDADRELVITPVPSPRAG
ncbi:hypothetical protein V6N00_12195 [Tersicoccus sp. MR15.9]|uniref:hypothetical protein n=1 Tax=Tersicoccus mangrovi TaxID=3121635 RepID=UPI002FE5D1AC